MLDSSIDLVRASLLEGLIIAMPILAAGLLIGLLISIVQAVTQIQEQTLTFVPKIVVMILVAILLLGWIVMRLGAFATELFTFGPNPAA